MLMEQKKIFGKIGGKKKAYIAAVVTAGMLAGIYLGFAMYFSFHFLPGTEINGRDFSLKTAEDFQRYLEKSIQDYVLTITGTERNRESKEDAVNVTGTIKGSEIELELASGGQGKEIMGRQNALLWPTALIAGNVQAVQFDINYNDKLLTEKISSLNVVVSGAEGARPARPVFDGAAFVIEPEVYGVSSDKIGKKIREYIGELKSEVSLMEEDCLEIPAFLSDSPEVEKACEQMNQYCLAQIVYQMEQEIVVDEKLISGWLNCDENMNVSLNEDAVGEWVRGMAEQYDTAGGTRSITTPTGKTAEVSGGTYGWKIDTAAETAALIKNIRDGDTVSREPAYTQRAATRSAQDWGAEYLEVDLTAQYMWYVKDGTVLMETDVVTGKPVSGMETPQGVYSILYTQQGAVLVGEINPSTGEPLYRTWVEYWMPFTQQGHGFHDADWQDAFGGNVYTYYGSHGCVNMPVDKAGELYAVLEAGTPVVVHY